MVLALQKSIGWRSTARVVGVIGLLVGMAGVELVRRASPRRNPRKEPASKYKAKVIPDGNKKKKRLRQLDEQRRIETAHVNKSLSPEVIGSIPVKQNKIEQSANNPTQLEEGELKVGEQDTDSDSDTDTISNSNSSGAEKSDSVVSGLFYLAEFWLLNFFFAFASVTVYTPWTHLSTMVSELIKYGGESNLS